MPGSRKSRSLADEIDQSYARKSAPTAFKAKYAGTCASCFLEIEVGDTVHYGDAGLVHHRHERIERPSEICDRCRLTKPCECD